MRLLFDDDEETEADATVVLRKDGGWGLYVQNRDSDEEPVFLAGSGDDTLKAVGVYAYTNGCNTICIERKDGLTLQYRVDAIEHLQDEKVTE